MKKYEPEALVAISRYQNWFSPLPKDVQRDVCARMRELPEEEKAYCDKGYYAHMTQILTSSAAYEVLQKHGKSEAEAYRIVSEEMWKFLDLSVMHKLAKQQPRRPEAIPAETLRTLKKAGTFALHDIFPKSKYGDMQAFAEKLRDMGCEKVDLIDTTGGKFMKKSEAGRMGLSGSALLTGRK